MYQSLRKSRKGQFCSVEAGLAEVCPCLCAIVSVLLHSGREETRVKERQSKFPGQLV